MLAVVLFMGAFFLFYGILYDEPSEKAVRLREEASQIVKQISSGDAALRIIEKNEINLSKIAELKNLSYDELKSMLRIEGDFCIYPEDEKGSIVVLNNTYKGIGSSTINISNTPCNETI